MNEIIRKTILIEAEKSMQRTLWTAMLIFIACGVTLLFFPTMTQDVATISLILFCFNSGVTAGLLFIASKLKVK